MKKLRRPMTWGLVLAFAFLTSVGEFLHFFPGCSHYVRQPDGSLFLVGQRETGSSADEPDIFQDCTRSSVTSEKQDPGFPVLDDQECTICTFSGLSKQVAQHVLPVTEGVLIHVVEIGHEEAYLGFFAITPPVRGPPLS